MPLIFALIMKDLPSGLCLYIFVSTVFGLLQQMFVYKRT
jgi:YidC/Oxa1 family membrane protein insertase